VTGATQAKSKWVMVWLLIALGVITGVAGAISLAMAYLDLGDPSEGAAGTRH
jgi:hypothetical protein